jgi:hypothetical protein
MVERRALATALLLIVTVSLLGTASAPDAWVLMATSLMTWMFSVVPQVMAPMAQLLLARCQVRRPLHLRLTRASGGWFALAQRSFPPDHLVSPPRLPLTLRASAQERRGIPDRVPALIQFEKSLTILS